MLLVYNILANVCNGKSWKDTFLEVLPARKGVKEIPDEDQKNSLHSSEDCTSDIQETCITTELDVKI